MPKKKSKEELSIYILKLLGMGAVFTVVSILSPAFLYQVLKEYLRRKTKATFKENRIRESLYYLKRKKFIAFEKRKKTSKIVLTKLGLRHFKKTSFEEIIIPKANWDNKWRVLTFDIPEQKKSARQTFRRKIKELGFFHFQRSVFIYPYPCEKEIELLTEYLEIDKYVHVITGNRFSSDHSLIKKFKL